MKTQQTEPTEATPTASETTGADAVGTRFCSSCSRSKPVLGGALVRCANGAKRWKCADCRARSKAHSSNARGKESAEDQS
jgi:hypothetical protein